MRKLIKVGKFLLIILLVFLISGTGYLYFGEQKISKQVVHMLQSNIQSESSFQGVSLDLFQHFPHVSVHIDSFNIAGLNQTPFIENGRLSVFINPIAAIRGQISIKRLKISNADLFINREKGAFNYQVFGSENTSDGGGPSFTIDQAILENLHLIYQDASNQQRIDLNIKSGYLSGEFNADQLKFKLNVNTISKLLSIHKDSYLVNVPLNITGEVDINLEHKYYTFNELSLVTSDTKYQLNGQINEWENHNSYDLSVVTKSGNIQTFIKSLPFSIQKDFKPYNVSGYFDATTIITGRSSKYENPKIEVSMAYRNGSFHPAQLQNITHYKSDVLKHVSGDLYFTNGGARRASSSVVSIDHIVGSYQGDQFNASVHLQNFSFPSFSTKASGTFPVVLFQPFLKDNDIILESGKVKIENLIIDDYWLDMGTPKSFLSALNLSGKLNQVKLRMANESYNFPIGDFHYNLDTLSIDQLAIAKNKSRLSISGKIQRWEDAIELNNLSILEYDILASTEFLNLSDFIITDYQTTNRIQNGKAVYVNQDDIRLPNGQLDFTAKQFFWGKKELHNVTVNWTSDHQKLIGNTSFNTTGGSIESEIELLINQGYHVNLKTKFNDIHLEKAFKQWNNFGQDLITNKNIKGKANGFITLYIPMSKTGIIHKKRMNGAISLEVNNGQLNNFELLDNFAKYIHIEDLRNLNFHQLRNYIEIKNGNVFLPAMFLQTNAANLQVNGIHGLDQRILYNIKVNAGQVLTNKFKKHNPTLKPLKAQEEGFFNLYYTIFGRTSDFQYDSNKLSVQSSFRQSEAIKQRVLKRLRASFESIPDWIAPEEWEDIPEYHLEEESKEIQFLEEIKG